MRDYFSISSLKRLVVFDSVWNIWRISFPIICSVLLSRLMQITDRIMLSHYSVESLNGVVFAMQAVDIAYFPLMALASISEIFVGQTNGKRLFRETPVPVFQIIVFLGCIWLVLFPILLHYRSIIIPNTLHESGCPFFIIGIMTIPIHVVFLALSAFFIGIKQPKIILPAILVSNTVNIFLDGVFIFGRLGFPAMGALGAGIASMISVIVSAVMLLCSFLNSYNAKKYNTRNIRFNLTLLKRQIKIGVPNLLSEFVEVIGFFFTTMLLSKVSENNLTIHNIALTLWIFFNSVTKGFQKGIITLASNYLGAGDEQSIKHLTGSMFVIAVIFSIILSLPMLIFAKYIAIGFNIEHVELISKLQTVLFILWISITSCTVTSSCFAGILIAGGDTKFMTYVRISSVLSITTVTYFLFLLKELNVIRTWLMTGEQLLYNGLFYYLRYKSGKWRHTLTKQQAN